MDNLDRATRLEALAFAYYAQATLFTGRRHDWRVNRGDFLIDRAYALIA